MNASGNRFRTPAARSRVEAAAESFLAHAASSENEDVFLAEATGLAALQASADGCDLFSTDPDGGLVMRASTYAPDLAHRCRLGRGVGLVGHVSQTGQPVFIRRNAIGHPKSVFYPGIDERDVQGMAVLPLQAPSGGLGVLLLFRHRAWPFSAADKDRLLRIAHFLGLTWETYLNAYRIGSRAKRMGALTEVAKTIAASPYLEEILQLLVNITAQRFGYVVCTVRLLDEERGELVLRATQAPAKAYQRKRALRLGESIAGKAIAENRPVVVADVQVEADYVGHDLAVEQGLRSMVCMPLTIQDKAIGVMTCYTDTVREFPEDEISALETLAKQAAVSIEHAKLQVRNTLMQEMHHRVKNSLQQVASLLRLQLRHSHNQSAEELLTDSLARILAISSVHDLLSREDLDHVSVRQVAEQLVSQQIGLVPPNRAIKFEVRGDDFRLNMNQATQVALILNELIQNAVQHGFVFTLAGEIHVNVEETEGEIGIWVSGSGDPLPAGFDPALHGNLGLQIVDNLSRGLGGRFTMEDRLGWTVSEVRFQRAGAE